MADVIVGQKINVNIAVWDFCGDLGTKAIYISDVGINRIPVLDPDIKCMDISGLAIEFKFVISTSVNCKRCTPDVVYSTWGTAYTDSRGYAYLEHVITGNDLAAYQAAAAAGNSVKVLACITGAKWQQVINHMCSEPLTVQTSAVPTHYVQFKLGFVPPEAMDIFDQYITQISDVIMTQLPSPPSPWVYVRTTYDRTENSFRIWLSQPAMQGVMMMSLIDDIISWILLIWKIIIGAILILLALFYPPAAAFAAILIVSGIIAIGWNIYDLATGIIVAETKATNLSIQNNINSNFDKGNQALDDEWEKSPKTRDDCLVRLGNYRDFYNRAILNSYEEKYAKYPDLITGIQSERTAFLSAANTIIGKFVTEPYTIDVCNTYYTQLDSFVNSSKVRVDELVARYIVPDKPYEVACKGWSSQKDCEKAECYWYDGACHKDEACWIPSPLGGCILSSGTGKVIVGTAVVLTILGITYWAITRKPKETRIVFETAKEMAKKGTKAAKGEYERVKTAYREIRAPQIPGTVPKVPVTVPGIPM